MHTISSQIMRLSIDHGDGHRELFRFQQKKILAEKVITFFRG